MMTTNEVWKQYADDIKRYIENKVHDEVITDDILQDTFIKIHTKLHTLEHEHTTQVQPEQSPFIQATQVQVH